MRHVSWKLARLALVALVLPLASIGNIGPVAAQMPTPVVTVATPLADRVTQWDEFSGRFEAVESVEIRARVSGFVEQIHFQDGQVVKEDDLLFTIDKRPFENRVASAEAEVARAEAQVQLQENEVARARPLVQSRAVTQRDFEQRRASLSIALAELAAARANLKTAQLDLEWAEVRAPIDGRISDRRVDVGELITGGAQGTTLLTTIVKTDPIYIVFDASEADYLRYARLLETGERSSSRDKDNPVRIKLSDEREWNRTGRMNFVDNQLNPRSGTIRGRAILENDDQLLSPGLFARLQLFGGEFDALLVPDRAIVSDQTRKIVFVVGDDNKVVGKPVVLGPMAKGLRVVRSGLDPTDRVVVDGIANPAVRPGATVQPKDSEIKPLALN